MTRDDMRASLLLYALLCIQVTDWITTVYAMSFGAYEGNPIMAPLFGISPWLALLPKLTIVAVSLAMYLGGRRDDFTRRVLVWAILAYVVVSMPPVIWNLTQLVRAGLL